MSDNTTNQMILDPNALMSTTGQDVSPIVTTSAEDQSDIVSQAFTSVEQDGTPVQYVTMTPEEAAAAGVMEEDQVVTTSLQFDPANPSVLYTADGTLINRSDLSPEEQALVQAALQQHLAEQEAEQQLAAIDQEGSAGNQGMEMRTENSEINDVPISGVQMADEISKQSTVNADILANSTDMTGLTSNATTSNVNLASPNTNAAQIVQTLANNVRRQQEYAKAQSLLSRAAEKPALPQGYRYEEKIVIRQGQPHVMKMPVKKGPPKKVMPELPAALANLMPKVDIGKDGNQVIRIHQSQITAEQLKSLQENPNVRLVFRPPSSSRRGRGGSSGYNSAGKRRGRPRKVPYNMSRESPEPSGSVKSFNDDSPPATTRYGRHTKLPNYIKDYCSTENGEMTEEYSAERQREESVYNQPYNYTQTNRGKRGRARGGAGGRAVDKAYRRTGTYASRTDMMREQQLNEDELEATERLSRVPPKPTLSSVEQAISTRRKNRLKELLDDCSEDDVMEVALPHLARVFSLWEFLVMKVEKNKVSSRVYFADVYKEYESLHKYVSRLTEKYTEEVAKNATEVVKAEDEMETVVPDANASDETAATKLSDTANEEKKEEEKEKEASEESTAETKAEVKQVPDKKTPGLTIKCKKLAESLGLTGDEVEGAFIELIDAKLPGKKDAENDENKTITDIQQGVTVVSGAGLSEDDIPSVLMGAVNTESSMQVDSPLMPTIMKSEDMDTSESITTSAGSLNFNPEQTSMVTSSSLQAQQEVSSMFTTTSVVETSNHQSVTDTTKTETTTPVSVVTDTSTIATDVSTASAVASTSATPTTVSAEVSQVDVASASASTVSTEQMQVDPATGVGEQVPEETTIETSENGTAIVPASTNGAQIIQIGTGDDRQYIEVPEGYTLIQTPNGLVMSQPGTTITQSEDGTIYVTNEDGTSTPLDQQKGFPLETVESLLSLDNQQQ